jgi:hypothetical protein
MVMLPSIVITHLLKYPPLRAQWPPRLVSVTRNVFVKAKYPERVRPELWQSMLKGWESYFSELCHILLITCRPVLFRLNYYFIHM